MKRFIKASVAAVIALTGFVATAEANVLVVESVSREVFYGDLNLNSDAGMATLQARIELAAKQVCGGSVTRYRLDEAMWIKECREKAIADAFTTVNVQVLSQNHAKKLTIAAVKG